MKFLLLSLALLLSTNLFANECSKRFNLSDFQGYDSSKDCALEWKSNKKLYSAQVVFLEKGCQRFEGAENQDCYYVLYCPQNKKEETFISPPVYDDEEYLNQYCAFSNPQLRMLLGTDNESPKSPLQAMIDCKDKKAVSISLKSATKLSKTCKL